MSGSHPILLGTLVYSTVFKSYTKMPDFDTEYVHWRKRFDVPKQLDEKDVKIEDLFAEKNVSKDEYVKKFLEVETREYIPKNNDIKPEFKEGERVYAKVKVYVKIFSNQFWHLEFSICYSGFYHFFVIFDLL